MNVLSYAVFVKESDTRNNGKFIIFADNDKFQTYSNIPELEFGYVDEYRKGYCKLFPFPC